MCLGGKPSASHFPIVRQHQGLNQSHFISLNIPSYQQKQLKQVKFHIKRHSF